MSAAIGSEDAWVIYMIRLPLLFLSLLGGCAFDAEYIQVVRESIKSNTIDNLDPFYKTNFSFVRATKGRNQAIFILRDYSNGIETWVGAENEEIITYKGLIIKTNQLEYDIDIHNVELIKEKFLVTDFTSYISITNPNASYLNAEFSLLNHKSKKCSGILHRYSIKISDINFLDDIFVCKNQKGEIVYSTQKVNPFDDPINLEFFYRYN